MRWLKWGIIIFTLLVIITPFSIYAYVIFNHNALENETYDCLLKKGYEDTEILDVKFTLKKLSLFTVEVIFTDEPEITYQYKKENKQIIQLEPNIDKPNHHFKHLK